MKNLILLGEKRHCLTLENAPSENSPENIHISDICYDPNEDHDDLESSHSTFLLFNSGTLVASSTGAESDGEILWIVNLNSVKEEPNNDTIDNSWFSVTFISELNSLVCLSHSGEIVSVDPQTGQCDSVGAFSNGISDGTWSPDEEILALFTYNPDGTSVMLTMNMEFEILNEVPVPQPNSVTEENNDNIPVVQMSWRPDATKIVVCSTDHEDKECRIRVYDRDTLEIQCIAREEDGSGKLVRNLLNGSGLAWGGDFFSFIIAAVQQPRKKKMPMVVFMEPNGLRHREFQLREELGEIAGDCEVHDLQWNVESDILAVTLDGKNKMGNRVQLWYRSNYHWYMKYELRYEHHVVQKVQFDIEKPHRVTVALKHQSPTSSHSQQQEWRVYDFCWDLSTVGIGCPLSTAAVVDGRNLNFTPFAKAIVPPPMYAATIQMDLPVNHIAHYPHFLSSSDNNSDVSISMIAMLSNGGMEVLGYDKNVDNSKNESPFIANYSSPSILSTISSIPTIEDATSLRQIAILSHDPEQNTVNLIAVSCTPSHCEEVVELQLDLSTSTCSIQNSTKLEGYVLRVTNWSDATPGAVIELTDGTLLSYSSMDGIIPLSCEPLLEPCPWISALSVSMESDPHPMPLITGMSKRNRLYCNDILISNAASSFTTNSKPHWILSYTTLGSISQLRTIPITALLKYDPLAGLDNEINAMIHGEGYEPRAVERGSVLVSISNSNPTAILQLPRGNLEAVFPRSLVIPHVMKFIDNREYAKAVEMMRKQKVDMNLIVDWDPERIVSLDAEKFVLEVEREDFLNLFIANLRNDDVTWYKYPIPSWMDTGRNSWMNSPSEFGGIANKVNLLCRTLRRAMLEQEVKDERHFLLPILSTFAKEEPPKLEEALAMIRDNALSSVSTDTQKKQSKSPFLSDIAQSSIQYLAFLANYEILYDTALGMYDFDLAKAVARNSQLDPKVYFPQLKRWKNMEPSEMAKYEVDLKLKRYESALNHLYNAGKYISEESKKSDDEEAHFQRCFDLINEHKLHALGLRLFKDVEGHHHRIMISLGERLMGENEGKAALSVFLATSSKDWEGAKRAAKGCGDWQTFFACFKSSSSQDELRDAAIDIAEEISTGGSILNKRKNMNNAARILLDYANDVEGAIEKMIAGELWSEARRTAIMYGKEHFERRIADSAASYAESCIRDLDERAETFEKSNERYAVVLKIRLEAKQKEEEYGEAKAADESGSTYSLASNMSNMSLRSNMSGSSVGSVGSVTSVSSVITAGNTSTFTMTSYDDVNKHKSKFNQIGRNKKKKKKKARGKSNKIRPGSQEELNSLVSSLKTSCLDGEYIEVIGETIIFLTQVDKLSLARDLYDMFEEYVNRLDQSQIKRKKLTEEEKEESMRKARKEGHDIDMINVKVGCEEEVDALCGDKLPGYLDTIFSYI